MPESEDDAEAVEEIQPFFDLADKYTAIYIYGIEDGMYRAGRAPSAFIEDKDNFFFNMSYEWTESVLLSDFIPLICNSKTDMRPL